MIPVPTPVITTDLVAGFNVEHGPIAYRDEGHCLEWTIEGFLCERPLPCNQHGI